MSVAYPHLGSAAIDADIEAAVEQVIAQFEQENAGGSKAAPARRL